MFAAVVAMVNGGTVVVRQDEEVTNAQCVYGIVTANFGRGIGYTILLYLSLFAASMGLIVIGGAILSVPFSVQGPVIAYALAPLILDDIRRAFPVTSEYYGPGEAFEPGVSANVMQLVGMCTLTVTNKLFIFVLAARMVMLTFSAQDCYDRLIDKDEYEEHPWFAKVVDWMPGHCDIFPEESLTYRGVIGFFVTLIVSVAVTVISYTNGVPTQFIGSEIDSFNPEACSGAQPWSQQSALVQFSELALYITPVFTFFVILFTEISRMLLEALDKKATCVTGFAKVVLICWDIAEIIVASFAAASDDNPFHITNAVLDIILGAISILLVIGSEIRASFHEKQFDDGDV